MHHKYRQNIFRLEEKSKQVSLEFRHRCSYGTGNRVKRRKLQWYGHVSHSSGLAKTILQGTVKGAKRQGRQRKRWEDNIREWTGLEFAKSQRAVENREKWGKLVAKSSLVPHRPSRLRDRRDEMI